MKKLLCIMFALVLTVSTLTACAEPNPDAQTTSTVPTTLPTGEQTKPATTTPTQPTTIGTQPQDQVKAFAAKANINISLGRDESNVPSAQWPIIVKSRSQLQELVQGDLSAIKDFESLASLYDEEFFTERTLILALLYNESEDAYVLEAECRKIEPGYFSGIYYEVYLYITAYYGPIDREYYILFIEVEHDIPQNAIVYIYDPKERP